MNTENLGNNIHQVISNAQNALFEQGELAQLTYGAFDIAARAMQESGQEEIEVTFPVGLRPDRSPIQGTRKYKKEELLGRYQLLAFSHLATNGLVQLVTIVEAMLGDIVRAVVVKYPHKLGSKSTIKIKEILESSSIEEVHLRATDSLLNELSYKSPGEFAEFVQTILSVNLLECPAFHRYMEIKASRDIFIHNRGIANEIYVRKAGTHLRVNAGMRLPADVQYFLESYEYCLQLTEWLGKELNDVWHSSEYKAMRRKQIELPMPDIE